MPTKSKPIDRAEIGALCGRNLYSHHGASLLATWIVEYWAARGFVVKTEKYALPSELGYGVRSDMIGGLPIGATWRDAV